ncbi:hypothetical protein [Cognatiyoonia sp. IB215182]|uniref:hypothetical protein n=1 Tax=Cognatiyoonia sp. IB215182 TaxID=3097353 RepID=UPI002A0E3BAF|nr:hypothetical protein [Cognatiyoonia sp. IB215182]MDX8352548.1 hypothetical protein [Cognatiyoonia sp. IB215182]
MASLALPKDQPLDRHPDPTIPSGWREPLNVLRVIALDCRSAAQADLFEACAVLSNKKSTARDAHARVLFKCMRQAISRRPVFYRPGVEEVSFDEAWLMRAITAVDAGDLDSLTFLIRSRVPKPHQRHIGFLIQGVAEQLSRT